MKMWYLFAGLFEESQWHFRVYSMPNIWSHTSWWGSWDWACIRASRGEFEKRFHIERPYSVGNRLSSCISWCGGTPTERTISGWGGSCSYCSGWGMPLSVLDIYRSSILYEMQMMVKNAWSVSMAQFNSWFTFSGFHESFNDFGRRQIHARELAMVYTFSFENMSP